MTKNETRALLKLLFSISEALSALAQDVCLGFSNNYEREILEKARKHIDKSFEKFVEKEGLNNE